MRKFLKEFKSAYFFGPKKIKIVNQKITNMDNIFLIIKVQSCMICGSDLRIYKEGSNRIKKPTIIGNGFNLDNYIFTVSEISKLDVQKLYKQLLDNEIILDVNNQPTSDVFWNELIGVEDKKNGIIAKWHDESHMNRWRIDNPPTKVLDCGYCYQVSLPRPHTPRILALEKDKKAFRSEE